MNQVVATLEAVGSVPQPRQDALDGLTPSRCTTSLSVSKLRPGWYDVAVETTFTKGLILYHVKHRPRKSRSYYSSSRARPAQLS
jgi:hypothetical protein